MSHNIVKVLFYSSLFRTPMRSARPCALSNSQKVRARPHAALRALTVDLSISVDLCRSLCRNSVGALSELCRLTIVEPLSTAVDLCQSSLDRYYATGMSICRCSVDLSICRSVDLSESVRVCQGSAPIHPQMFPSGPQTLIFGVQLLLLISGVF